MEMLFMANSKKYNEHCIAGIDVDSKVWVRPVSQRDHGEFGGNVVRNISILDVLEFNVVSDCSESFQCENVLIDESSIKKIGYVEPSANIFNKFLYSGDRIFGNRGKAVHKDEIFKLNHSLEFIKVVDYRITKYPDKHQVRIEFDYNGCWYDLPVTDLGLLSVVWKSDFSLAAYNNLYLTLSLALEHNEWHSKLVAGVLYF
jgi:hypothetical protein